MADEQDVVSHSYSENSDSPAIGCLFQCVRCSEAVDTRHSGANAQDFKSSELVGRAPRLFLPGIDEIDATTFEARHISSCDRRTSARAMAAF